MRATYQRLYINVDHVATLRQARGGAEPSPIEAAAICLAAGADGITAHLREDRRHIQDADVESFATTGAAHFNLEAACTDEIVAIALRLKPVEVTFVPEKRQEVTTEGGLDVSRDTARIEGAIQRLHQSGIRVALFIDPDDESIGLSKQVGADAVELHTGQYALSGGRGPTLGVLVGGAAQAASMGLAVHAGHGLTVANVGAVAAIPEIEELNIGHSIVSRAIFVGLADAVREMRAAMDLIGTTIAQLGAVSGGTRRTPARAAPPLVPVESLLYRGRAALERALEIRSARVAGELPAPEAIEELLDLIALAAEE